MFSVLKVVAVVLMVICAVSVGLLPAFGYGANVIVLPLSGDKRVFLLSESRARLVRDALHMRDVPVIQTPWGEYFDYTEDVPGGLVIYSVLVSPEGVSYLVERLNFAPAARRILDSRGERRIEKVWRWFAQSAIRSRSGRMIYDLAFLRLTDTAISGLHPAIVINTGEFLRGLEDMFSDVDCGTATYMVLDTYAAHLIPVGGGVRTGFKTNTGFVLGFSDRYLRGVASRLAARYCSRVPDMDGDFVVILTQMHMEFSAYGGNGEQLYIYTVGNPREIADFTPAQGWAGFHRMMGEVKVEMLAGHQRDGKIVAGFDQAFVDTAPVVWAEDVHGTVVVDVPYMPGYVESDSGFPVYLSLAPFSDETEVEAKGYIRFYLACKKPSGSLALLGGGYILVDFRYTLDRGEPGD